MRHWRWMRWLVLRCLLFYFLQMMISDFTSSERRVILAEGRLDDTCEFMGSNYYIFRLLNIKETRSRAACCLHATADSHRATLARWDVTRQNAATWCPAPRSDSNMMIFAVTRTIGMRITAARYSYMTSLLRVSNGLQAYLGLAKLSR